jgi:hypothetical protein
VTLDKDGEGALSTAPDLSTISKYSIMRVDLLPGILRAPPLIGPFSRLQQWKLTGADFQSEAKH